MSKGSNPYHSIFVGDIPYDCPQSIIEDILCKVGPIVKFEIKTENGRSKGFGFCEYRDRATVIAAKKLLQGHSILGRQLKIDFSSRDKGAGTGNIDTASDQYRAPTVDNFLSIVGESSIRDFLQKFQRYCRSNLPKAQKLLFENPVLSKALVMSQARLKRAEPTTRPSFSQMPGAGASGYPPPPVHGGFYGGSLPPPPFQGYAPPQMTGVPPPPMRNYVDYNGPRGDGDPPRR